MPTQPTHELLCASSTESQLEMCLWDQTLFHFAISDNCHRPFGTYIEPAVKLKRTNPQA